MSKTANKTANKTARKPRAPKQVPQIVEPTPEQIATALASIDTHMETATVAGAVDHHTQLGSWHDADSMTVFDQFVEHGMLTSDAPSEPVMPEESLAAIAEAFPELFGTNDATEVETAAGGASESISDHVLMLGGSVVPDLAPAPQGWDRVDTSSEDQPVRLEDLVAAQDDADVSRTVFLIEAQITGRESFETDKSAETGKSNIFLTLKKVRTQMVTKRVAAVLNACQVDPAFINRTLHDGSRYNVYALGKLSDIIFGVSGGGVANAINIAVIKSLFKCRDADIPFTKEVAKACCSKQVRIDARIAKTIERYTVSTSTAPTQASSTMQALVTLGVVEAQGMTRAPIYQLTDRPLTRKLEAMLAVAA